MMIDSTCVPLLILILVHYEMDVYWIVNPDQDPIKLLEKYGSRFELIHLKDMKQGTPSGFTGHSDVTNNVPLGTGVIGLPALRLKCRQCIRRPLHGLTWSHGTDSHP